MSVANTRPLPVTRPIGKQWFTPASATATLPYVARVVRDIMDAYHQLETLRIERSQLPFDHADVAPLNEAIADRVTRLNEFYAEIAAVGCELKDWARGLVDFPALHEGRPVWLCWRPGESAVTHWHEWQEGFRNRQTIGESFEAEPETRRKAR